MTDEQFDDAISEAKEEGNLTRSNVATKLKPERYKRYDSPPDRPEHLRGTRHIDSNRIVEQTILGSGISDDIAALLDYSALDRDRLEEWISSLSEVIRSLTTMKKCLQKELIP